MKKIDYVNHIITWEIKINSAKYNMGTVKLVDTLGDGLSYIDNPTTLNNASLSQNPAKENQKLTFTINNVDTNENVLTYQTKFDPNTTSQDKYTNTADLYWGKLENNSYKYHSTDSASYTIKNTTKNNGYKIGNLTTNENGEYVFNYRIGINYNLDKTADNQKIINGTTITDTLTGGQQLDKSTFKIYKLNISDNNGGEGTIVGDALDPTYYELIIGEYGKDEKEKQVFTIKFLKSLEDNQAYQIQYSAKDVDNIYAEKYENKAESTIFTNGSVSSETLKPTNGGKALEKTTGTTNGRTQSFKIDINQSQSHLPNAVLTDEITVGQGLTFADIQYVKDSFKLVKAGTTENVINQFNLNIDQDNGKFTINFGEKITDAYTLTYDVYYDGTNTGTYNNKASLKYKDQEINTQTTEDNKTVTWTESSDNGWGSASAITRQNVFVKKVDSQTGEPLANVKFELYNVGDTKPYRTAITNENGIAKFTNVKLKDSSTDGSPYEIKEVQPATGYVNSIPNKKTITFTTNNAGEVTTAVPYIIANGKNDANACQKFDIGFIQKVTDDYKYAAEFKVTQYENDGQTVKNTFENVKISDDKQHFIIENADGSTSELITVLTMGKYEIEQTNNVAGYVSLSKQKFAFYDKDCALPVQLEVKTLAACNQLNIALQNYNQAYQIIFVKGENETTVSSNNGKVVVPDKTTIYDKVKIVTNDYKTFEVNYNDLIFNENCETVINIPQDKSCTEKVITIKDHAEAQFTVTLEKTVEGQVQSKTFTSADGKVTLTATDNVYWEGAKATIKVKGYADEINVPVLTFEDCKVEIPLKLAKCPQAILTVVDKDDVNTSLDLTNATVTLVENSNPNNTTVLTVSEDGKVVLPVLDAGEYTITVKVPGYSVGTETITVSDCVDDIKIVVDDKCDTFTFTFTGTFDEIYLKEAAFKVVDKDDNVVTDTEGKDLEALKVDPETKKLTIENIPVGEYKLVSDQTPAGYAKIVPQNITVTGDDCHKEIQINTPCLDFKVKYEGPENSTAKFKLTKKNADGSTTVVEENIGVNSNGYLEFKNEASKQLEAGTYSLVQTERPAGYYASSTKTFTVTTGECLEELKVTNNKIPPTPQKCDKPVITVTPAKGEQPEAGTKVTLVTEGKTITGTVDQSGNITIDNNEKLTPGKSVEITVEGYEPVTTTLDEIECQNEVTITPLPTCEKVPTITIDPSVKPAEDTKVTVTPEGGSPITGKTDSDGKVVFYNEPTLTPGEKVTITVDGFKSVTAVIPTECGANITVAPEVLGCAQFDVVVKDANGEAVSGATVTVDGTNITGLTDEAGKVQLTNKDFAMTAGSIIIITKEGFETKQVTISDSDNRNCAVTVVFDKVEDVKACPEFKLNPTEDIIGATVTVTGETTVTGQVDSEGNIVYDNDAKPELTPGTTIVISKEGFESKTIVIDADSTNCEVSLNLIEKPKACPQFTVTVKDENGPVSGANVFVKGTNASGTTNEQGQVVLENKDITENSVIEIAKDGYATQTVKANEDCEVTVTMTKATTEDPKDPTDPGDEPGKTPDENSTTPEDPNENPDNTPSITPPLPITPPVINPVPSTPENPDGTPENPDGTPENPDGTPENPDGTPENPDGTPENPDGTPENPDGTPENPDGTPENPDGTPENSGSTPEDPDGTPEDPKKPTNSVPTPNKKPGNSSGDSTVTPDGKDDDTTPTPVTGKQLPNGKVNIPVNATPGVYYDLYDSEGNLIASNVLANADGSITLDESLASGTYTLKPVNGNGEEITFAYDGLEEAAGQAGNNQAGDQTAGNTSNQVAGNNNNGNHATTKTTTLLPQTGTQVAFYTLFGIVLMAAAFFLFKRSRRKAS